MKMAGKCMAFSRDAGVASDYQPSSNRTFIEMPLSSLNRLSNRSVLCLKVPDMSNSKMPHQ